MKIYAVDFREKRLVSVQTINFVLEAELEFDYLMELGEDEDDTFSVNAVG